LHEIIPQLWSQNTQHANMHESATGAVGSAREDGDMCGRFAMNNETNALLEQIVQEHGASAIVDWQKYWPANYNVAPTQDVPVAREVGGERFIDSVRWGMVAPYAKEFGGKPTINARLETVATNGMFKGPFEHARCVVPALGYYEWQEQADGKQPFFVHHPKEPLALAGIVRTWHDPKLPKGDPEGIKLSMAIITMDAHVTPGEVHDREPAFLVPEAIGDWLGEGLDADQLTQLLLSSADAIADELTYYPVSRSVNKVQKSKGVPNDGPELIEPIN
jgi:putative SOS response-associated peptidase YedK